ncbi:MAG TPA: AAA family ATPase, partial [Bacteroidales bacterium]|nr:AAA family ATPase [Bacteroidales bacterium]
MLQPKSHFFCKNCGTQSVRWLGRCPSCGEFNTFEEEVIHREKPDKGKSLKKTSPSSPKKIEDISLIETPRLSSGYAELDNVLGGGIVNGSLVLLGGEPGIGKSTLLLQMALSVRDCSVLYVSGEESEVQLKMRANRLETAFLNEDCYILTETN